MMSNLTFATTNTSSLPYLFLTFPTLILINYLRHFNVVWLCIKNIEAYDKNVKCKPIPVFLFVYIYFKNMLPFRYNILTFIYIY